MKIFLTSLLLLFSAWASAQEDLGPQGSTVTMAAAPVVTVVQGKGRRPSRSPSTSPAVTTSIPTGPKSEFLIPTALKVEATTDIVIGKTTYPEGQDMSLPSHPDEKLNVYTGDFEVDVLVRPLHSVTAGKYVVRGTLKYQACDNWPAIRRKQLPVSFDVKIAKAPAPGKNPAQSPHAHQ